jgi:hypothetical protein
MCCWAPCRPLRSGRAGDAAARQEAEAVTRPGLTDHCTPARREESMRFGATRVASCAHACFGRMRGRAGRRRPAILAYCPGLRLPDASAGWLMPFGAMRLRCPCVACFDRLVTMQGKWTTFSRSNPGPFPFDRGASCCDAPAVCGDGDRVASRSAPRVCAVLCATPR